jgi:hypothetical protein
MDIGSSGMSERYRLVFRGEVLDGQHKAVVKQRLGAALKVEGERLDAMFTGKAVTIRKDTDTDTAARFQIAFKRAGARLRVLPLEPEPEVEPVPAATQRVVDDGAFKLAPPGARMSQPAPPAPQPSVDLAHLTLAAPGTVLGVAHVVEAVNPDVSRFTLAAPGADLGVPALPLAEVEAPSWDIAELGADLGPHAPTIDPPLELDGIDFELAPAGTPLLEADDATPPQPPDTSHLRLE